MWNGVFVTKHRDYLHGSVWSHLRAAGATATDRGKVRVSRNPITEEDFDEPRFYRMVDVVFRTAVYVYLIESAYESEKEATEEEIEKAIEEYVRNPVPGGRFMIDYLAVEELESLATEAVNGGFWG